MALAVVHNSSANVSLTVDSHVHCGHSVHSCPVPHTDETATGREIDVVAFRGGNAGRPPGKGDSAPRTILGIPLW